MQPRWQATVQYRADDATVDVTHDLVELYDLHPFIERGPHWDTIIEIKIVRVNHVSGADLTIEQAEKL